MPEGLKTGKVKKEGGGRTEKHGRRDIRERKERLRGQTSLLERVGEREERIRDRVSKINEVRRRGGARARRLDIRRRKRGSNQTARKESRQRER